ncbi:MAG TPA: glycosyltransferase [Thermoanaerobaculia bacterium]|nr:glycosyltransferase [Thermoanaerobaculia bacterium]
MSAPRVTVLTTVYNGARYLAEAIDSILAEEFTDFEYVIVDDGSTDETPQLLERAAARDPRIRVLRLETNRGIAAATNCGLAIARGAAIARLDADDISLPGRLAREVAVLDAHPDVAMVSMNYEWMDADGVLLGRSQRDHPPAVVEYLLNFSNSIGGHSQVMFRRSAIEAVHGYDESCRAALDYDLWTRIVRQGRIVVLPEIGMRYRVHDQNLTSRAADIQIEVGKRVVQRTLSAYLGRTLSEQEVLALMHAWRPVLPVVDAKLANDILREAYRIFCSRESDERTRGIVRKFKAQRLMNTAALLLAKGEGTEALRHARYALGWHAGVAMVRMLRIVSSRARGPG